KDHNAPGRYEQVEYASLVRLDLYHRWWWFGYSGYILATTDWCFWKAPQKLRGIPAYAPKAVLWPQVQSAIYWEANPCRRGSLQRTCSRSWCLVQRLRGV